MPTPRTLHVSREDLDNAAEYSPADVLVLVEDLFPDLEGIDAPKAHGLELPFRAHLRDADRRILEVDVVDLVKAANGGWVATTQVVGPGSVVQLKAVRYQPVEGVVRILENALERARRGETVGIVVLEAQVDRRVETREYREGETAVFADLLLAAELWKTQALLQDAQDLPPEPGT